MFYAILTLAMITSCCVIGLCVERWQSRRVDKRTDILIATLKAANECVRRLNDRAEARAAAYREAHRG